MAMTTSAALATASIASSAVGAGMSFTQANKQRGLQKQAEADAVKAMAEARQKLDVNFAEQMSIKKEAYDLERQAMLVAGAQATEAGMMSERGAAATAGRVFAGQQQAQGQIRSAMADEMTNIEGAILEEEGRLRDLSVGLDLQEVAGQQQRAADAQAAALAANQQGIEGIANAAEKGVQYIPLYPTQKVKTPATTQTTPQFYNYKTNPNISNTYNYYTDPSILNPLVKDTVGVTPAGSKGQLQRNFTFNDTFNPWG